MLSVVVTSFAGESYLVRCLRALAGQEEPPALQIIVPCDESVRDVGALRTEFPTVEFPPVSGRRHPSELRAIGCALARGELVAVTEDHCIPDSRWCASIVRAHESPHAAVGGVVDKADRDGRRDTALDWAAYLCDFGRYMPPVERGRSPYLTDCNVTYKRSALEAVRPSWGSQFNETTVHWALEARGETLWLDPAIIVRQQRSVRLEEAIRERYAYGRLFATTRVAATTRSRRVMYAAGSFLLPGVLVARLAVGVVQKRRGGREFVRALPALGVLSTVWALGELVGYVTGRPAP